MQATLTQQGQTHQQVEQGVLQFGKSFLPPEPIQHPPDLVVASWSTT